MPEYDELPGVQIKLFFGRFIDIAHYADTTADIYTAGDSRYALCRGYYVR